jgi:hypothetical protein
LLFLTEEESEFSVIMFPNFQVPKSGQNQGNRFGTQIRFDL